MIPVEVIVISRVSVELRSRTTKECVSSNSEGHRPALMVSTSDSADPSMSTPSIERIRAPLDKDCWVAGEFGCV
mgnify:CR=1 FL=1|jgi:hypothetical protein